MKWKIILTLMLAFFLLNTMTTIADEMADLQSDVDELKEQMDKIQDNQKKQPSPVRLISEFWSQQTSIGGHVKFFLADQSFGTVNDEDQHNAFALGVHGIWLYFNKTLRDWLKLTIAPEIVVVAEATPSLGNDMNRSSSASVDLDLDEAYFTVRLPKMYELKVGVIYPLFSEEYATKSWWHEQYHNNNGLVALESWQSMGLELYRNFDFPILSLPLSLAIVNGEDRGLSQSSRFTDNNNGINALLHLAPELFLFGGRLRVLASAGWGFWDDKGDKDSYQVAAGAEYSRASLTFSGEYLYRFRSDLPLIGGGTEDGTDQGWYAKAKYEFSPKWRFVVKYSDVRLWAPGADELTTDNYRALSGCLAWWITDSSTIMPQLEYVDADRQGTDDSLTYLRYTLGWRTTF